MLPPSRFAPFQYSTHVYSVAELLGHIGALLEADPVLQDVWVRGEITSVSRSPAGHSYFTLKDGGGLGQLRGVLFRGSAFNSPVMPTSGVALVAHGSVHLYERQGGCELIADLLFPEGVGLAQMRSEVLYRRLEAEGLFDPGRKRPLPAFPRRIGIISSEQGAVIHDVLNVLARRYPLVEVVFLPAPVQGPGAAEALRRAVQRLGRWRRGEDTLDLLVLARGGGSDEDLAAFNDEGLVRAIFGSPVPVVSAVGHETNLTLADLVADLRAPTPSAAAELLVPDVQALRREIRDLDGRCAAALLGHLRAARGRLDGARVRLEHDLRERVGRARLQLDVQAGRLRALSPVATLARGYAIAEADGRILRDAGAVDRGARLRIQLHRGRLTSTVEAVEPESS